MITDKSVALVESLETILPNLRRLSSAKLDKQQTEDLVSMLDKLILYVSIVVFLQSLLYVVVKLNVG